MRLTGVVGRLILAALIALPLGSAVRPLKAAHTHVHDAYIWQRRWTPALGQAVAEATDLVRTWRVLAAQSNPKGPLQSFAPDLALLARTERSIVAVVRLDKPLSPDNLNALADDVVAVATRWRETGARLAGLELDHDCATARLPLYAQLLERVRARMPADLSLSITALPTWLATPEVERVFAQVDEVVLQVHAVQSPRATLLDPQQAVRWVRAMARHSTTPFRVALPTYGVRVGFSAGIPIAEAEVPLWGGGPPDAVELMPTPSAVATLVHRLEQVAPRTLRGFAWFRLPTGDDVRAWSLPTWRAVLRGEPLASRITVATVRGEEPGLTTLMARNDGDDDGALPRDVILAPECTLADGVNGYRFDRSEAGVRLRRDEPGRLPAGQALVIGWARCTLDAVIVRAPA